MTRDHRQREVATQKVKWEIALKTAWWRYFIIAYEQFLQELEAKEQEAQWKHEAEFERMCNELECEEQERALREAFKAEEHRKHQKELEQKHREGDTSCQTIKESYKFLPVLHTS